MTRPINELQKYIETTYGLAKAGDWNRVLSEWHDIPVLARRCSRFQSPSSGWTFLHQAAYFGHEVACRELIRMGASVGQLSFKGKHALDVALERRQDSTAVLLRHALMDDGSLWIPSLDPDLHPSSNLWHEAVEYRATETMLVAYGGGVVFIPIGSRYFSDSFGRILIGWHGSFDPPSGMDGEPMF